MTEPIRIQTPIEVAAFARSVDNPIVLVVEDGDKSFCGLVVDDVFGYRIGIGAPDLGQVIPDFMEYESSQGRTPLVFALTA